MRIAVLSPFHPYRGGIASFSNSLYIELEKEHEVKAFSFSMMYPSFLFPGKTQFVAKGESEIEIDSARTLSSINPLSYRKTAKKINQYQPDVLIIAYWMPFMAPALGSVCKLLKKGIKKIALIHNAIPHEKSFIDKTFAKFFFAKCDGFIALSNLVKKDILEFVPDAKVLVHPHPIYNHYRDRYDKNLACSILKISSQRKNLLFFGLIREYKGLDVLIDAMQFLDNDYQLIIAGESYENFSKYQELIDTSPLKKNIKVFEQYVPDEMVSTFFSASDLLVLPYRSATQSGVVTVAYQLELPMVVTNVGALGETVQSAGTGIVVETLSPGALAEGIKKYFEESKQDIYLNNIRKEKKRLSWSAFTRSAENFIREI